MPKPGLTRADAPMLRRFARTIMPRRRWRPSEWAETNLTITKKEGAGIAGPYRCGHYPWLRTFHDLLYDNPGKRSVVAMKASQKGLTLAAKGICGSYLASESGTLLYLIGRDEDAREIADDRFFPMFKTTPTLRERFAGEGEEFEEGVRVREYDGGKVYFSTAGSASAVSAKTVPMLCADEFDQCEDAFPKRFGAVLEFMQGRQTAVHVGAQLWIWSHPTTRERGVARVWENESDQGTWVFDCPRCSSPIAPRLEDIRFGETLMAGAVDPHSAWLACPACGGRIEDHERQAAVWEIGTRPGATGRRHVPLPDDVASRREFVGFWVPGLCDPYLSVRHFARLIVSAGDDQGRRQAVWNVHGGQPYSVVNTPLTPESVERLFVLRRRGIRLAPGGTSGVKIVTCGADVQAPKENPTIYAATVGFAVTGDVFVAQLELCRGFAGWHAFLRSAGMRLSTKGAKDAKGDGGNGEEGSRGDEGAIVPPSWAGIDDAWPPGEVKSACRARLYSEHAAGPAVRMLPVRFVARPGMNDDTPWVERPEEKCVDPARPELGAIPMYDLYRHFMVDWFIRRWNDGKVHVLCDSPADLTQHLTAQILAPKRVQHQVGWRAGEQELAWDLAKGRRDDWMMAIVYAIAAALTRCRLGRIHLMGNVGPGDGAGGGGTRPAPMAPMARRTW